MCARALAQRKSGIYNQSGSLHIIYRAAASGILGYAHACVMKGVVNLRREMQSRVRQCFSVIVRSDYYVLARFLFPLSFTVIAVDIGEQVSMEHRWDILFGPWSSNHGYSCLLCLCFAASPHFDIIRLHSFPHKELDIGMPQFNLPCLTLCPSKLQSFQNL